MSEQSSGTSSTAAADRGRPGVFDATVASLDQDGGTAAIRAGAIVEQVIARRRAGEQIADDEVIDAYPELAELLREQLRRAALVELARASSGRAPSPIENLLDRLDGDPELAKGGDSSEPDCELGDDTTSHITTREDIPPGGNQRPLDDSSQEAAENHPAVADDSAECDATWFEMATDSTARPPGDWCELPPPNALGGAAPARLDQAPGLAAPTRYRPSRRPPMSLVRVFDDDQAGGEVFRLRTDRTTIGRRRGDILIPHDSQISGLHAEIRREPLRRGWRWVLADLSSTNGVYVKVRRVRLRHGDQLVFGDRPVRFHQANTDPARLEEVCAGGEGESLELTAGECWIGRDASVCAAFLSDCETLDPRFARITYRDGAGWSIWSETSTNGLWVKVDRLAIASGSVFQLGQQRFSFHTP